MNKSIPFKELGDLNKGRKPIKKVLFILKMRQFFEARENILNYSKINIFPIEKSSSAPTSEPRTNTAVFYTPKRIRAQSGN